jgi:peptidoglycan DL-endopeptidase RipA
MNRRVNPIMLLGLIIIIVLSFGLSAGAQPVDEDEVGGAPEGGMPVEEAPQIEDEVVAAEDRLMELRKDANTAGMAYNNALAEQEKIEDGIVGTTRDLAAAEEDLEEAKGKVEDRASQVYKSGRVGFMDVLLGAEDFSELAKRLELWVRLLREEKAELQEVSEARDNLQAQLVAREEQLQARPAAIEEAEAQMEQATALETEAQEFVDALGEEVRSELEVRRAEQLQAAEEARERILAEVEASGVPVSRDAPTQEEQQQPVLGLGGELAETSPITGAPVVGAPVEGLLGGAARNEETQVRDLAPFQGITKDAGEQAAAEQVAENLKVAADNKSAEREAEQRAAELAAKAQDARRETNLTPQEAGDNVEQKAKGGAGQKAKGDTEQKAKVGGEQKAKGDTEQKAKGGAEQKAKDDAEQKALVDGGIGNVGEQKAKGDARQRGAGGVVEQQDAVRFDAERRAKEAEQEARKAAEEAAKVQDTRLEAERRAAEAGRQVMEAVGIKPPAAPITGAAGVQPANQPVPTAAGPASGGVVMAEGARYLGAPYVWGGSSPGAVDCSGFLQAVFRGLGRELPADPGALYGSGVPVPTPQAGDIVAFDEHGSGISHVGLATGGGTMLHASDYFGTVVETPIHSVPGFVGASRVI